MMHDYSQASQDEWVLSIIKHKGYFVDMGAYDGRLFSNTLKLEQNGWTGLCIEGNPNNFEKLKQNRKCSVVNMAIDTYCGVFQITDDESSSQRTTKGGIYTVCNTIGNILKAFSAPPYIDYISSDLERMDAEIWEQFPFDEYSFGLATVEHCLCEGSDDFKKRIMKVMLENGYVVAKENVEHDGNLFEDWYMSKKLLV